MFLSDEMLTLETLDFVSLNTAYMDTAYYVYSYLHTVM